MSANALKSPLPSVWWRRARRPLCCRKRSMGKKKKNERVVTSEHRSPRLYNQVRVKKKKRRYLQPGARRSNQVQDRQPLRHTSRDAVQSGQLSHSKGGDDDSKVVLDSSVPICCVRSVELVGCAEQCASSFFFLFLEQDGRDEGLTYRYRPIGGYRRFRCSLGKRG
jgi:hypothetical protein